MRVPASSLLSASLLVFAACTAGDAPAERTVSPDAATGSPATSPATSPAAEAVACATGSGGESVSVVDFAFEPSEITVSVGDTITWTNNGQAAHTVTFNEGPDCGTISSGEAVSATFNASGTYPYICRFHSQMEATVTVNQ